MYATFKNRTEAAKVLCEQLEQREGIDNGVVLALPRGGVPIGFEIARSLHLPLDVFLSKKIGYPGNPEFAIGSVTLEGTSFNGTAANVDPAYLKQEVAGIRQKLRDRHQRYYGKRSPIPLKGKTVILVDDGIATGNTIFGAIDILRKKSDPAKIIVAVPVAPTRTAKKLDEVADEFICPVIADHFFAIGAFYEDFTPVEDEQVVALLEKATAESY